MDKSKICDEIERILGYHLCYVETIMMKDHIILIKLIKNKTQTEEK